MLPAVGVASHAEPIFCVMSICSSILRLQAFYNFRKPYRRIERNTTGDNMLTSGLPAGNYTLLIENSEDASAMRV